MQACSKYRKFFLDKYGYIFCESCHISYAFKFEVHHLYHASLFPRHKHLHDNENLIMLCDRCHSDFHAGKRKEEFKKLEKNRGLKKLFS